MDRRRSRPFTIAELWRFITRKYPIHAALVETVPTDSPNETMEKQLYGTAEKAGRKLRNVNASVRIV